VRQRIGEAAVAKANGWTAGSGEGGEGGEDEGAAAVRAEKQRRVAAAAAQGDALVFKATAALAAKEFQSAVDLVNEARGAFAEARDGGTLGREREKVAGLRLPVALVRPRGPSLRDSSFGGLMPCFPHFTPFLGGGKPVLGHPRGGRTLEACGKASGAGALGRSRQTQETS
jgi:hypothetical protein